MFQACPIASAAVHAHGSRFGSSRAPAVDVDLALGLDCRTAQRYLQAAVDEPARPLACWLAFRLPHARYPVGSYSALAGVCLAGVFVLPRPVPWQRAETLSAPRLAVEAPKQELHLHFHGVTAEEIAAIITG